MKPRYMIVSLLLLGGCGSGQTLDARMVGKSPQEQQEILRVACLEEAERIGNADHSSRGPFNNAPLPDSQQTARFKAICREMSQHDARLTEGDTQ